MTLPATTTIAHISDMHFGTEIAEVKDAILRAIIKLNPDILIVSGDITQRATSGQFAAARDFLQQIPAGLKLIIPGNHDIPLFNPFVRFFSPYARYKNAFGAREAFINPNKQLGLLGLDATSPFRHTDGYLDEKGIQLKLERMRCELAEDAFLLVAVHQPLLTAWEMDMSERLINAEAIAALFSHYKVDLVLSGHVHVPMITTTQATFASLPYHFILSSAGTAISHRTRVDTPNSFNIIHLGHGDNTKTMQIIQTDYDKDSNDFILSAPKIFGQNDLGWQADIS